MADDFVDDGTRDEENEWSQEERNRRAIEALCEELEDADAIRGGATHRVSLVLEGRGR